MQNLQTRIYFKKKSRDQVDKTVDQFYYSKCIPNVSFKFISCQEICKYYLVISNCNFCMRRCFKYKYEGIKMSLREKWPNTELLLVRIFPHTDWIRIDTSYLSVFSPYAAKYGPEITSYLVTFTAVCFYWNVDQSCKL